MTDHSPIQPPCVKCGGLARPASEFCMTCTRGFDLEQDMEDYATDVEYEFGKAYGEGPDQYIRRDFTSDEITALAQDLARRRGVKQ